MSNNIESRFSYGLASPLNGKVLVRAIATNSIGNSQPINTLYMDQLMFVVSSQAAAENQIDRITGSAWTISSPMMATASSMSMEPGLMSSALEPPLSTACLVMKALGLGRLGNLEP